MSEAEINIRTAAKYLKDEELFLKIGHYDYQDGPDFTALEVKYHHQPCQVSYLNKWKLQRKAELALGDGDKRAKKMAKKEICEYVKNCVLKQEQPLYVTDILEKYRRIFVENGGSNDALKSYNTQNLTKLLQKNFPGRDLEISADNTKKLVAMKAGLMSDTLAREKADVSNTTSGNLIWDCAMQLRQDILSLEPRQLQEPLSVDSIMQGEVYIPDSVKDFLCTLYTGSNKEASKRKQRLVDATAADMVYSSSGGKLLPGKHLALGLAIKSMTGSRTVTNFLNRFGHCISNEKVRKIDMGLESTINQTTSLVPKGILKGANTSIGLAWDNFDINLETLSGENTIHHTYGICYQNIQDNGANLEAATETSTNGRKIKDISKVTPVSQECIDPYHKTPKMTKFKFTETNMSIPDSYPKYVILDLLWSITFNFLPQQPMWTGWNTLRHSETQPQQKVTYMKPISLSPNRLDVIHETLLRSKTVCEECGAKYSLAGFDLLIAKAAKQIQCAEHPKFETVFIQFGQFHTECNIFSSTGRLIEGSGGPYILTQAGIIAAGSMNRFLKGKMYNRCRRGHILLYCALQGLHFNRFLEENKLDMSFLQDLQAWSKLENQEPTPASVKIAQRYENFISDTINGELGKTAKFWMQYCKIIELYLTLHRAIKVNDVDLYAFSLFQLAGIFFMTNHINYSRWMTYYALELWNLKYDRSDLLEVLENGGFSINRTGKTFSRVGVDMALEQTINAEAKSRLKGIVQFADVSTAVNRWMVTGSTRSEVVNRLLELTDLSSSNSEAKELNKQRIERDKADVEKLKENICSTVNPFGTNVCTDVLFNMRTGKQASSNSEEYLLKFIQNGDAARDNFVKECVNDNERFERPIKKTAIVNFATANFLKKNKSTTAQAIAQVKGTRDLLGRLLSLSLSANVDIKMVFQYPLLSEPACFAHPDGSIRDSPKSKVFHLLKAVEPSLPPANVDTFIIDGMFLLRVLITKCNTYQVLARKILTNALKQTSNRVDLCFDVYESPSIKDIERIERGNTDSFRVFSIGGKQRIEGNTKEFLSLSNYKKELLRFLKTEFQNEQYAPLIAEKVVYCAIDNECVKIYTIGDLLKVEDVPELYGEHLEADTRVMLHAKHADSEGQCNIVIRANDADIFIVMLSNVHLLENSNLWYDAGRDSDNSREYIDITAIAKNISYTSALAGIYGFLGNDYSPAFFHKGKVRPIDLMTKFQKFVDVFSLLGEAEITDEMCAIIEEFVCYMYGYKKQRDINMVRSLMFEAKTKPRNLTRRPLDGLKSIDPTLFPPCKRELEQHIRRAWYIARLYKAATEQYPCFECSPIDFGWKLSECKEFLDIDWYHGDQVPIEIDNLTNSTSPLYDDENESDTDYEESDSSDSDDDEDIEL